MVGSDPSGAGPGATPEGANPPGAPAADGLRTALIAETGRKSSILWVRYSGSDRARPAWYGWTGDAVVLIAARAPGARPEEAPSEEQPSEEQRLPGLAAAETAEVIARSKDAGNRLLTWRARVRVLTPHGPEWDAACAVLCKERLNTASMIDRLPQWWARTADVIRLEPTGEVVEEPGAMGSDSGAAPPPPSPATTTGRLPWVLGRRARRNRRLS